MEMRGREIGKEKRDLNRGKLREGQGDDKAGAAQRSWF